MVTAALRSGRKTHKQRGLVKILVFMSVCVCLAVRVQFREAARGNSSSEEYVETRMWWALPCSIYHFSSDPFQSSVVEEALLIFC